jgi:alpha-L-rhamnosidase
MKSRIGRRDLVKGAAAAVVTAGLSKIMPAQQKVKARNTGPTNQVLDDSRFAPRRRPECLEISWKPGTGLIWMAEETLFYENPRNRFMRFRRSFNVGAEIQHAELRLFADTHYIAWLNGEEIGRGPGRSDPTWTYFDTCEVTSRLRVGTNTLAVLVLFQGFGTGGRRSLMQALLAHLSIRQANGDTHFIVSDNTWRASPAEEFIRPTPRLHATLG